MQARGLASAAPPPPGLADCLSCLTGLRSLHLEASPAPSPSFPSASAAAAAAAASFTAASAAAAASGGGSGGGAAGPPATLEEALATVRRRLPLLP